MKKLFIFLILFCILVGCTYKNEDEFNIKKLLNYSVGDVCCVVENNKTDFNFANGLINTKIACGNKMLVFTCKNVAYDKDIDEIDNIEFNIYKKDLDNFLNENNVKLIKKDKIENKNIYYGYSCFFEKFILLNNFKINLQIVEIDNEFYKIGYPLIYSSY